MSRVQYNMALSGQPPQELTVGQKVFVFVGMLGLLVLLLATFNFQFPNKTLWLSLSLGAISVGTIGFSWSLYANTPSGIKNDGVWFKSLTSRGLWAWVFGILITLFYVVLYFFPQYLGLNANAENTGLIALFDPLSKLLSGNPASQWFLYGTLYTLAIFALLCNNKQQQDNNRFEYETIKS